MNKKEMITLIIPCFNEEEAIPLFYTETDKVTKKMKNLDFGRRCNSNGKELRKTHYILGKDRKYLNN